MCDKTKPPLERSTLKFHKKHKVRVQKHKLVFGKHTDAVRYCEHPLNEALANMKEIHTCKVKPKNACAEADSLCTT